MATHYTYGFEDLVTIEEDDEEVARQKAKERFREIAENGQFEVTVVDVDDS